MGVRTRAIELGTSIGRSKTVELRGTYQVPSCGLACFPHFVVGSDDEEHLRCHIVWISVEISVIIFVVDVAEWLARMYII